MPIAATDIQFRLSHRTAGQGNTTAQADANASLGGFASTTQVPTGLHALFDVVNGSENTSFDSEFRCIFIVNTNATDTYPDMVIWVDAQAAGGADISLSLDNKGNVALDSQQAQAFVAADEDSAPVGLPGFTTPTTKEGGLIIGNLGPLQCRGFWIRRGVSNVAPLVADSATIKIDSRPGAGSGTTSTPLVIDQMRSGGLDYQMPVSIDNQDGNGLLVTVITKANQSGAIQSITDNGVGNTFTKRVETPSVSGNIRCEMWLCADTTPVKNLRALALSSAGSIHHGIHVAEVFNLHPTAPVVDSNSRASGSAAATATSGSYTPTEANELVYAAVSVPTNVAIGPVSSGWTELDVFDSSGSSSAQHGRAAFMLNPPVGVAIQASWSIYSNKALTTPSSAPSGGCIIGLRPAGTVTMPAAKPKLNKWWGAIIYHADDANRAPESTAAWNAGIVDYGGKELSLMHFGNKWNEPLGSVAETNSPIYYMQQVRDRGAIPYYDWNLPGTGASPIAGYSMPDILAGTRDTTIDNAANALKAWGHPVIIRMWHEFQLTKWSHGIGANGTTEANFKAAWIYTVDRFNAIVVPNVYWHFCANQFSTVADGDSIMDNVYPGDAYVNFTGFDYYNWGWPGTEDNWRYFEQVMQPGYEVFCRRAPTKKQIIGEFNTAETNDGLNPGTKASWFNDFGLKALANYSQIAGWVIYDSDVGSSSDEWRIDGQHAVNSFVATAAGIAGRDAFRASISQQQFISNEYSTITTITEP